MILKLVTPLGHLFDEEVLQINFEALDGYRAFLPKHIDFLAALPASIIEYTTIDGDIHYIACNRGIIVKKGANVMLSVRKAIMDDNLETLSKTIAIEFKNEDQERKTSDVAMAKLEAGLSRGFQELKGNQHAPI